MYTLSTHQMNEKSNPLKVGVIFLGRRHMVSTWNGAKSWNSPCAWLPKTEFNLFEPVEKVVDDASLRVMVAYQDQKSRRHRVAANDDGR